MKSNLFCARALILLSSAFLGAGTAFAGTSTITALPGAVTVTGPVGTTLQFHLKRTGDTGYDAWLHYATMDDSAQAGEDYTAASGRLHLPAAQTAVYVPVSVFGSRFPLPDKSLKLKLAGIVGTGPVPSFATKADFTVGSMPDCVTAADVNGDGRPDLITAHGRDDTVSVLLNKTVDTTAPDFGEPQTFSTGTGPFFVTAADMNGDGRPDLVTANTGGGVDDGTVSVLLNTTKPGDPTATFDAFLFNVNGSPTSVTTADMNGDGKVDLITANNTSNNISILLNTSTSTALTFAETTAAIDGGPVSVAAVDVNDDDKLDLVTANQFDSTVSVLLNNGAGTPEFTSAGNFASGNGPQSVTAADVNGDGKSDLITTSPRAVSVLLNTTTSSATDFETQKQFDVGPNSTSVAAVDVNGDDMPDVIAANGGGDNVSVLLNATAPGATAPAFTKGQTFKTGTGPFVTVADVNGDGMPDLITANQSDGTVSVLRNTTTLAAAAPAFAADAEFATGDFPLSVTTADMNGDGKPDLITGTKNSNHVSVLLNMTIPGAAAPIFAKPADFSTGIGAYPVVVAAADVNGDGKVDLITGNRGDNTGSVSVLWNTTTSGAALTFEPKVYYTYGYLFALTSADVNGDGKVDLVTADLLGYRVYVLLNTTAPGAAPTFAAPVEFDTGVTPLSVAATDVNGDGKIDLVTANDNVSSVSVLLNTTKHGGALAFARYDFVTGGYPQSLTAADVNGDGKVDLATVALESSGSSIVSVLLNNTIPGMTPAFAKFDFPTAESNSRFVTSADMNADGKVDLITANSNPGGSVSMLLNTTPPWTAVPQFAATVDSTTGGSPRSVKIADLNGDSHPDLITANSTSDSLSALLNTQYAISTTPASVTGTIHYSVPIASGVPAAIDFGSQPLSGAAASRTFTLENTGNTDLTVSFAMSGANSTDFDETDNCGGLLAAGASCTVTVAFQPGAIGARNAALTLTSNGPDSPQDIALTGSGDRPPVAVDATLTVHTGASASGKLEAADADGDSFTFRLVDQPEHGTAEVNPDGSFTYKPAEGYVGADHFAFIANDGALDSAAATVTITVDNGPLAARDMPLSVHLNTEGHGKLEASGAGGDALTFAKAGDPKHGKATVNPDGTFTYTPDKNYVGHDSFAFAVSEGAAASPPAAVHILVTDGIPVVTNSHLTALASVPAHARLQATDPDGDPLAFHVVVEPDHGRLTIDPDGRYTYTPDAGYAGSDSFLFRADDGALQSDPGVVGIEVLSEAEATGAHDSSSGGAGGLGALGLLGLGLMAIRRRITRN
ncbi:MAG TPA: FG-GAP-like repeat-containing protein [Gammaproteobacteria bacterium]|nr:FG-GAP-like repeat-containing protein [Gammaproteobacteria bacterium]